MTRILIHTEPEAFSVVQLQGDELHYLLRVRRHTEGDAVELRTPSGRCFTATVIEIEKDAATLTIQGESEGATNVLPIRLLVSLPKRRLLDDVIRTASEIGIERICPVISDRTVVHPKGEKLHRWRRVAEESLRQCGRRTPLVVEDILPLTQALKETPEAGCKVMLHPLKTAQCLTDLSPFASPVTAAVGPEGGFTDSEVALALSMGFRTVRLNTPILRIETAAIATAVLTAALIQSVSGEVTP